MTDLPTHPTLPQLQQYLDEICKERGWTKDSYAEKFLLFTEEVGELAKAIRKTQGLYQEKARQRHLELEEEFADVLSYLLDLANPTCKFFVKYAQNNVKPLPIEQK